MNDFSNRPLEGMKDRGIIADCPKCSKTALRVNKTPDMYHCIACNYGFYKEKKKYATG